MKFSIGYNNDLEGFLKVISNFSDSINSIYFPIPKKYMGSGRDIPQAETQKYIDEIFQLMNSAKSHKIETIMLLNSTVPNYQNYQKIIAIVKDLNEKKLLDRVAITDPFLIIKLKKKVPNIKIETSILCFIKNIEQAKYFNEIGADTITIERDEIKNLKLIKKINEFAKVKVLINEGCIKNCIFRYTHYNAISSSNLDYHNLGETDRMCTNVISKQPYKILSSPFVRPEDLKFYNELNIEFKISTRNISTNEIEHILKAYISEKYDGNLMNLLNSPAKCAIYNVNNSMLNDYPFFEKISNCNDDCENCRFCIEIFEKIGSIKKECLQCSLYDINQNFKESLKNVKTIDNSRPKKCKYSNLNE